MNVLKYYERLVPWNYLFCSIYPDVHSHPDSYTSNYALPSRSSCFIIRGKNFFPLFHLSQRALHLNPSRILTFRVTFNSKCTAHIYAALYAVRELCVVYTKPRAIKVSTSGDSKKWLHPEISVPINRRQHVVETSAFLPRGTILHLEDQRRRSEFVGHVFYIYVYYRNNGASKECAKNSWKRCETHVGNHREIRTDFASRTSAWIAPTFTFLSHINSQKYTHTRTRIYVVTQLQEGTSLRNPVSEFAPRRQPLLISSTVGIMAPRVALILSL